MTIFLYHPHKKLPVLDKDHTLEKNPLKNTLATRVFRDDQKGIPSPPTPVNP